MKYITLLLLFSTLVLCRALPVESGADNGVVVSNPNANPFDLGAVTECRRPSTNVCSIDYDVPASIASLAEIIEFDIQGRLSNPIVALRGGESCRAGYLQTLCAFRFPRCDGTNVVMRSLPNCTQATARCSSSLKQLITAEGLCQLQATVPLDSCAPLSESQVEFQHCSVVEESTSVTAWMLEYMNLIDEELVEKFIPNNSVSSLWNPPACSATTAQYYCQFYGQCTGNGRIEVKNTEGFCDNVINCYSDTTADALRNTIDCPLWPHAAERPSSPSPSPPCTTQSASTSSLNQPSITKPEVARTWPVPPTIGNNDVSLHQVTGTLLLTSLVLSIFMSR